MGDRIATVKRESGETAVLVSCSLDGRGQAELDQPIGFLGHLLTALAKHSRFDLTVNARGDTEVDDHHLCEDLGLTIGRALRLAWSGNPALCRFGQALLPMDDALALVAVDISGRPYLAWDMTLPEQRVGSFDAELVPEFLRALTQEAGITLHVRLLAGRNAHHSLEAVFKALGLALRQASRMDVDLDSVQSSKGEVKWLAQ